MDDTNCVIIFDASNAIRRQLPVYPCSGMRDRMPAIECSQFDGFAVKIGSPAAQAQRS